MSVTSGTLAPWANLSATAAVICLLSYQITVAQPEAEKNRREEVVHQRQHFLSCIETCHAEFQETLHQTLQQQREFSAKELEVQQMRSSRLAEQGHAAVEQLSESMDKLAAQIECLSTNSRGNQ